jgi:hypothetical protein
MSDNMLNQAAEPVDPVDRDEIDLYNSAIYPSQKQAVVKSGALQHQTHLSMGLSSLTALLARLCG